MKKKNNDEIEGLFYDDQSFDVDSSEKKPVYLYSVIGVCLIVIAVLSVALITCH